MATWTGEAWLGSESGRQKLTVQASTITGAYQQFEQIYGSTDVWNVREVRNNNSSDSSSSSNIQLPSLKSLLVGGVVLYGLSLFGGNVTQLKEMVPNTQQMEYSQPSNNVIQYSEHHVDDSIPEFFNTEFQDEPVNDLGQDWDN